MIERERRPTDPNRPALDRHDLAVEGRRPVGDPGLGQDQALGPFGPEPDRLTGHLRPVANPGDLAVGQVDRVVDVAHGVGVGKPNDDLDTMPERAGQVARVGARFRPMVMHGPEV